MRLNEHSNPLVAWEERNNQDLSDTTWLSPVISYDDPPLFPATGDDDVQLDGRDYSAAMLRKVETICQRAALVLSRRIKTHIDELIDGLELLHEAEPTSIPPRRPCSERFSRRWDKMRGCPGGEPSYMDISIPQIWQRVGMQSWYEEVKVETLAGSLGPGPFLLVMHWPVSASYLSVSARRGEELFCADSDDVLKMIEEHRIPRDRVPVALIKRGHCLAKVVSPGDMIILEFELNTDEPHFLEDARASESGGLTREIEVLAVVAGGEEGPPRIQVGALHVHLEPAAPMRKYNGFVALDLGNTSTTLVCMHA